MAMLSKEETLFERDEEGKLMPQKVELEPGKKNDKGAPIHSEEIVALPMNRAQVKRYLLKAQLETTADGVVESSLAEDRRIVLEHCIEPKFTEKDVEAMKTWSVNLITATVLRISGLKREDSKVVPKNLKQ